eukprot:6190039-Pleurochrysis_carterae.AAC.2
MKESASAGDCESHPPGVRHVGACRGSTRVGGKPRGESAATHLCACIRTDDSDTLRASLRHVGACVGQHAWVANSESVAVTVCCVVADESGSRSMLCHMSVGNSTKRDRHVWPSRTYLMRLVEEGYAELQHSWRRNVNELCLALARLPKDVGS